MKIPLEELAFVDVRGSQVDIGMRSGARARLQRITLELFTPESATELRKSRCRRCRSGRTWPEAAPVAKRKRAGLHPLLWTAVAGSVVAVAGVLVWVLTR